MSRRTGQDGYIEASGKWWVVRWWMDVAGQEARKHMRAKICPISGPGHLSKSQRERRAREVVAESGADTLEHFDKVVKQAEGVTFREQTKWWLDHIQRRKRKPIAPATLELWKGCLEKWINPNIGDLPLSEVNNMANRVSLLMGAGWRLHWGPTPTKQTSLRGRSLTESPSNLPFSSMPRLPAQLGHRMASASLLSAINTGR